MKKTRGVIIQVTCFLVFLSLSSLVSTRDLVPKSYEVTGKVSEGSIYYQDSDFITINNPLNPINVEITSMTNSLDLNFCYNYLQEDFPVSGAGVNMPNCPEGAFALLTAINNSSTTESFQKLSRTFNQRTNFLRAMLSEQEDTETASQINVPSSTMGGIVVAPTSSTGSSEFTIKITYYACEDNDYYPIGVNNSCEKLTQVISTLPNEITTPAIPANSWIYYSFSTNVFSSSSNNYISVSANTSSTVYLQQDYIPTSTWYLASASNGEPIEIYTPGTFSQSQTYYIGIFNNGADAVPSVLLNISLSPCNSTTFGYQCQVQSSGQSSDPLNQITQISADLVLDASKQTSTTNNGTVLSFDYDDDAYSGQYLYFSITNPPASGALRIGVAANDHDDNAPNFYAKLNGYPSSLSYHYATKGDSVSNQMVIPVSTNDKWFVAVQLPADFSIWVGTNCANNCSQQLHGSCYCSTANGTLTNCMDLSNNGSNPSAFYIFPTNVGDSSGLCECEDDLFGGFECTDVLSYTPVLVILVVTLVTAVILVIVIALPSYFYLKHKKKLLYEQL